MHFCFNCGRRHAQRQGDSFMCPDCQHAWTVEDEQRMAVYIRAQGFQPAEPAADVQRLTEPAPGPALDKLTKAQLVELGATWGLELSEDQRKDELIALLIEAGVEHG